MSNPAPTQSTLSIFKDVYRANLPLMIAVILIAFANSYVADGAINPWNPAYIAAALYALIPLATHHYVLSGGQYSGFRSLATASPIITLIYVILASAFCIGTLEMAVRLFESLFFGHVTTSLPTIFLIAAGAVLSVILCCSTLGMIFPAIADHYNLRTAPAIRILTPWRVFWRLTVLTAIFAVLAYLMIGLHKQVMGLLDLGIFDDHGVGITLIQYTIITLLVFSFLTLIAVILTKAYLGSYTKAET